MVSKLLVDVLVNVKGDKDLDSFSGKLQRTGTNLTKYVTLPLVGAAAGMVSLASDAEKSQAKLESVFKSMGADAFTTVDALNAQADALADATTFDDEGIKEAQARLLTFGDVTGDVFDEAVELSADLSTVFDQDLSQSSIILGKALNDPIKGLGALSRIGIQFSDDQKQVIADLVESGDVAAAQGLILDEVAQQVGGAATALGQTDTGKAQQALEELGEAGESLGAIILPALAPIAQAISGIATAFQGLPGPVQTGILAIAGIAAAAGPAMLALRGLMGAGSLLLSAWRNIPTVLGYVDLALGKIGVAFRVLTGILLTNPFVALAAAVIAIATLIILNWDKVVKSFQNLWRDIQNVIGAVSDFLGDAWDAITATATAAWEGLEGIIRGALNALIDVINGFFGFLNGLQFGAGPWDVGPIHIDAVSIDPFNIGLIPHLASGGIVSRPTVALLGENGPEAVVPLSRVDSFGRTLNLTVLAPLRANDMVDIVEYIDRSDRLTKAMDWEPA